MNITQAKKLLEDHSITEGNYGGINKSDKVSARPTLTDVMNSNGSRVFADGGAVNTTDGSCPVKECSACLGKVVFVQSKAGKWYLANVYRYGGDSPVAKFYYMKHRPHHTTCDQRRETNARLIAGINPSEVGE